METLEIVLLCLGIVFFVVSYVTAIKIPEPTPSQLWVFRVIMAMGAACLGALLPGFLELGENKELLETGLRAGGALAVFIFVYRVNPARAGVRAS